MWCSVHSFDQQNLPTEMTSKRRNFQKLNQIKRGLHTPKSQMCLEIKLRGRVVELELRKWFTSLTLWDRREDQVENPVLTVCEKNADDAQTPIHGCLRKIKDSVQWMFTNWCKIWRCWMYFILALFYIQSILLKMISINCIHNKRDSPAPSPNENFVRPNLLHSKIKMILMQYF